ncbi:Holliday junction branch migration protein RuvA [Psychrobacter sp.]|uniref:Holliday junction branch migration protein RuvA n=1 Tax=Psychrobacter sp. TaxID=56811 RepID=UPI0026476489|nr:Holliday junction branch migration protein RuvA [Psychrobacter sp.]MDN6276767.1 Holliday junction branch migration protein RuvA [Psychrobacter sp.]MDN6307246.1 Holliday junction branch migration protein RuvA [Psychrobacter sp.]
MIGLITGQVTYLMAPTACILTASGVGYDIELPLPSFCQLQLDQQARIWTHFHVREDAQLLYGFIDRKEREVFRQLIKINGVGAKMALAMLSAMSASELKMHVEQESESALTRIPGIGKKTAQRLLIELKDKLKDIEVDPDSAALIAEPDAGANGGSIIAEVEGALISLGYKEKEAQQAIKAAQSSGDSFADTQGLLKATLQQLSGFK